jgi:heptosyltransferase-1
VKVLVIKLSSFGDIIHALPALEDLRARPEVDEVHWLVDARYAFVADVFPPDVHVHRIAMKGKGAVGNTLEAARTLRRQHFDVVLDLQGLIKTGILARLISGDAYGFDAAQTPEWPNPWFVRPVPFHRDETHVVQVYRRIAAGPFEPGRPGAPMPYADPAIPLTGPMTDAGRATLTAWELSPATYAVLHLGGSYATKRLPEATWAAIAGGVHARGLVPLLLWGNAEEQAAATRIRAAAPAARLAPERLGMPALCGLLGSAAAYIGVDTGVSHLAAAVGARNICIWGPTSPQRMGAMTAGTRHIVAAVDCGPCFKRRCEQFVCMPGIRADHVLEVFDELVAR